jgi:integrase
MTARQAQMAKDGKLPTGMHPDGGGLYAQITERGASWIYRYRVDQKHVREMGLGSLDLYGLKEARALALDARRLRHRGIDPIDHRRAARAQAKFDEVKSLTFDAAAEQYAAAHRAGWRSSKHAEQWMASLDTHVSPVLGALPVQAIDTPLVLRALEPIWTTKPETASRVRGRIEAVLDWAKARGYRAGENPARLRGHLDHLLPAPSKVRAVKHHAALDYRSLPAFMAALRERQDIAARALEFTILTAARVGEVLGARWSEFNLLDKVWIIPGGRMKSGREHRVPLSGRALAILEGMQAHRTGEDAYVFPSSRAGAAVSDWSIRDLVTDRGTTVHGFRSSFRDWAAERTNFPSEVAEMALAHAVGSKVEVAYRRGDMFEKRRRLAEAWANYCMQPAGRGEVVALRG